MFSPEAHKLRARWNDVAVQELDFSKSPFGLTEKGLIDFRGLMLQGTTKKPLILEKPRFEKCDMTYSRFIHCRIQSGLFIACDMTLADFHTCDGTFTSPGSIREAWVWHQRIDPLMDLSESLLSEIPDGPAKQKIQLTRLDKLDLSDLDKPSVLFYCDNQSIPSATSFQRLIELLNGCDAPPHIFVLDSKDYVTCSEPEKRLLQELFPYALNGMGECSWFKNKTLLASRALSTTCIVDEIESSLAKIGIGSNSIIEKKKSEETDFWNFVRSAYPRDTKYSLDSHIESFHNALMKVTEEDFHRYRNVVDELSEQLESWAYTDAACCIEWCSDDSFTDFSASIILRDKLYSFLSDPVETLVDIEQPKALFKEGLYYVFYNVQEERQIPDVACNAKSKNHSRTPAGTQSSETSKGLRERYPRLYEKYRARKNTSKSK